MGSTASATFVQHPDFIVEEQRDESSSEDDRQQRYNRECEKRFGIREVLRNTEIVQISEEDLYSKEEQTMKSELVVTYSSEDNDYDQILSEERFDFAVFVNGETTSASASYLPLKYQHNDNTALYREMISPDAPKAAFLPFTADDEEEKDNAQACYLRSVWLSTMLYGEMKLPAHLQGHQGHGNSEEVLIRDLGMDPLRYGGGNNRSVFPTFSIYQVLRFILSALLLLFFGGFVFFFRLDDHDDYFECDNDSVGSLPSSSSPKEDYRGILDQVRARRKIAQKEGWSMPLVP